MIAQGLFLTNWHCGAPSSEFPAGGYWSEQIVKDTIIDMSWDGGALSRDYVAVKLVDKDSDLDFALLRVEPIDSSGLIRPPSIRVTLPKQGAESEKIEIIHHPAAMQKQISYDCAIVNWEYPSWQAHVPGTDFTDRCDTEGGSSGAPVFDPNGNLVGIHHLGFDVNPLTCKQNDDLNKGIRIDKIIEFLRTHDHEVIQELRIISH
jgi:hypothetical protein